jgi:VWFA-related protein
MKKQLSIALFFFFTMAVLAASFTRAAGQQSAAPGQSPTSEKQNARPADKQNEATKTDSAADAQNPAQRDKDDVVRISVTLVQVDAVVVDGKGQYVTDLQPEDFEISEDGKRQHITNFSYVSTQPPTPTANLPEKGKPGKNEPPAPPTPPTRLRPEQVRRTIALVVDDLGLSFESTAFLRDSLKKFVNQQMQPGDLVAIIRTGAGVGALQQFTTDKRLLNAAIERIRWNPNGRGGISAFAAIERDPSRDRGGRGPAVPTGRDANAPAAGRNDVPDEHESLDRFREDLFAVGTLGAINFVVRGLRELPGRKSVILFSDGFRLFSDRREVNTRVYDALRRLTDLANRASVVIYTMDARGLQTLGLTAADDTSSLSSSEVTDRLQERREQFLDSQEGLQYLAGQTGGFFFHNNNDLNRGIRRVLDDQQGYYLLGYVPEAASFRTTRGVTPFHKISVKVKRAGLHVRSRTGFYGFSDETMRPAQRTPAQQLWAALTSPFASGDIRLKLTSLFGHDLKAGAFMRSMLHIDPNEISFTKEADGQQKAVVDIVAFTFGDNGQVIDRESREFTFRVPEETYQKILRQGLLYNMNVAIKKPGAYQLRVAVRDATSEKIGSANQFIEVPDISKKRLALSGLVVAGNDPAKQAKPADTQVVNTTEGATEESESQSGPSMRILRPGMVLSYAFVIYNATIDRVTTKPQLEAQVRLLRDGQAIYTGKQVPVNLGSVTEWRQIFAGGLLELGKGIEPGEYVLQVIISDLLAKEKYSSATQWIDFEIVK